MITVSRRGDEVIGTSGESIIEVGKFLHIHDHEEMMEMFNTSLKNKGEEMLLKRENWWHMMTFNQDRMILTTSKELRKTKPLDRS